MEIRKIGPEYARELGRLEKQIYPTGFRLGWKDYQKDLKSAEAENRNFSFGLFDGSELVGYITAYTVRIKNKIFISDIALVEKLRDTGIIFVLLKVFLQATSSVGLSIFAECREDSFRLFTRHPDFFKRFGYVLTKKKAKPPYAGEPSWAIRFDRC